MTVTNNHIRWTAVLRFGVACMALSLCLPYEAQYSSSMHFDRLAIDDGLSQSNVQAIAQDASGFLWFGTENGLNRFDGYSVRQYYRDPTASSALQSDFILDISVDAEGNLWIATDGGGVARWDPRRDAFTVMRHDPGDDRSIGDNAVNAILATPDGVWIGMLGALGSDHRRALG